MSRENRVFGITYAEILKDGRQVIVINDGLTSYGLVGHMTNIEMTFDQLTQSFGFPRGSAVFKMKVIGYQNINPEDFKRDRPWERSAEISAPAFQIEDKRDS